MNTETIKLLKDVDISYSRGHGKGGKRYNYIRPKNYCFNRSRKVSGFTDDELDAAITKLVKKWYYPMSYFTIQGEIIGSNTKENALKEFWNVCNREDIGKEFSVTKINQNKETLI